MLPNSGKLPDVEKIAVLRANGLGDLMFTMPALDALRAAYPSAEITLLGREIHADLLTSRPGPVDRVIIVPPIRGVSRSDTFTGEDSDALEMFCADMRRERFDLALQLHGGGQYSNPVVTGLGARVTAGLRAPDAPPLDRWVPYVYFQHEVLRFLEAVGLVGASAVQLSPCISVTPADLAASRSVVPVDQRPLVVLHPGAGDARRRWPAASFAALGDRLVRSGARVVVTGVPDERDTVAEVLGHATEEMIDVCGLLSIGGLAGLLARARVVVSNDSGPLHLAAAVGSATVGIFWCLNLINAGQFTRARHRVFLGYCTHCPACGRNTITDVCDHAVSHVADVGVEDVTEAAIDLLCGDGAGRYDTLAHQ